MADDEKRDDVLLVLPLGDESKLITQTIANDTARQILELLADGALSTSAIAKKLEIPLTTAQYNVEKLIEAKLVVVEKTRYSEKGREVKLYAPARRMIVLVPANTSRQAVMDVLKKYLVLLPLAGFVALMVELAMQFLNGNLPGSSAASKRGSDNAPLLSAEGSNLSATGTGDANTWSSGAPGYPPAPGSWPNVTDDSVLKSGMGNVSGPVTDTVQSAFNGSVDPGMYAATPNGTGLFNNTGGHGLIPPDLLNHYGLWFFVGCLLIIGVMIAYELYRGRQKK
jgi:predicted transcriptional regulator